MEGAEKRRTLYSCRGAALHSKVAGYVAAAQNEKIQLWSNILGCIKIRQFMFASDQVNRKLRWLFLDKRVTSCQKLGSFLPFLIPYARRYKPQL